MGILALAADERVIDVAITEDELTVRLMDGRSISVPLAWYPRLLNAKAEQRQNWQISGGGYGIHWEEIDEDLSIGGLLRGVPGPQQSSSAMHAAQLKEGPYEHSSVGSAPSSIPEDGEDYEKGVLDYYVEAEEASTGLLTLILGIGEQMADIRFKIEKRTANITSMNDSVPAVKPSDLNTIFLLVAADINDFSKGIEETIPKFERNTHILEKSLSVYISLVQPEDSENIEQLHILKESLSALLETVRSSKESMGIFKNTVQAICDRGISYAINKATSKQSKALDGLIVSIGEFESFSLRIRFQIDEKLGQA